MRDSQRGKVYASEREAFPNMFNPYWSIWKTAEEIQNWINSISKTNYFHKHFCKTHGSRLALVKLSRGLRSCMQMGIMKISSCNMNKFVVCHELAHAIAFAKYFAISRNVQGHGWQFCATYLHLIRHYIGLEEYNTLKASFKKHKVKFRAPRKKRKFTPEQRLVLVERMRKCREAKNKVLV